MSWFDAGALANIAKSALKEAQKTIDKALDIKEDDSVTVTSFTTPIDLNQDDFFGSWDVEQHEHENAISNKPKDSDEENKHNKLVQSIWGSFAGSFFDTTKDPKSNSVESLEDSVDGVSSNDFSRSKLVVQHSEEEHFLEQDEIRKVEEEDDGGLVTIDLSQDGSHSIHHHLSFISTESSSDHNISESIDVITHSVDNTSSVSPEWEHGFSSPGMTVSTSSSVAGLKQTSESVEILGDSLTSPSSVEVIDSDDSTSRRQSQLTEDIESLLQSPDFEAKINDPSITSSPSVEVIAEDQDENSVAEDTMSYTSISESTSATVLDTAFNVSLSKPPKMLKDTYNRPEFSESVTSDVVSLSPDKSFNVTEAITRAPSRGAMHLPLTQVNQVLIDTQPQSINKQDMTQILETTNIIDIPMEDDVMRSSESESQLDVSTDDGSQSDRTLVENQENVMESSSDTTSTTTETSSNSTYLKNMLADAMSEKTPSEKLGDQRSEISDRMSDKQSVTSSSAASHIEIIPRETSPLSSEKSDLVKIGSDNTSCHTSCDELETTTSSDIEIISSPNGDSSSTQSRQSPVKRGSIPKTKVEESTVDSLLHKMTIKMAKGHNRELSEASSISDDSHPNGEMDRLLKRISEMTDILESRESKLSDITRRNAELQEQNSDLKNQLDCVLTQQLQSADVTQVTEEYTQRLSALEKKFQQAIREKDSLRKQLDQAKLDAATRMSKGELESKMSEKDQLVKELREEGEKLSKQQLQHSNIIKKLRSKEKEHETTIKHLKFQETEIAEEKVDNYEKCCMLSAPGSMDHNESLSLETDRLKKSLSAKEEVERTQIEAVHQLTNKNKKLENELAKLSSQLEDLTQKYDTTKKSLDAAKKELIEKSRASSELVAREQLLQNLENQKKMTESQNEEVLSQLDDLRYKLRTSEEEYAQKEQKLRQENHELLRRLEEAEGRNEELSQSVLEVSKPLVRQLESLQSMHNLKVASFERAEQELTVKINDLKGKLQTATTLERTAKEESIALRSKLADIEGQLATAKHEIEIMSVQLEQAKTERLLAVQEIKRELKHAQEYIKQQKKMIETKEKEIENLKQQLNVEKTSLEVERKRLSSLQETHENQTSVDRSSPNAGSNSPTLSLGKISISESMSGSFWSQDEPFEVNHAPRYTNMFEMQMLQSNLKQREGEVQQLQWELNRREQERALLNSEISTLLTKVESLEGLVGQHEELRAQFASIQQQYDTLCQLYGEKVEENEELKLDLEDVKQMYKCQIDELLRQQREKK